MRIPRDYAPVIEEARARGWRVEPTRASHIRLIGPAGQRVTCPGTPSDSRGVKNLRADIRRAERQAEARR